MTVDKWERGSVYESYVGRWSREVASKFLAWLAVPVGRSWLDVGCGTGSLSQVILRDARPAEVKGIDRSEAFVAYARDRIADERASFAVGDAEDLQVDNGQYDAVVSGLVLNFVPDHKRMADEMKRAAAPGGVVAAYVWDYADQMAMLRVFWDVAAMLDPGARELDEGPRFLVCKPEPLAELFASAGLRHVEARAIDILTRFQDFDDYWTPFLGGQGPAPSYVATLPDADRAKLRDGIRARLPVQPGGAIELTARAWAVRGLR